MRDYGPGELAQALRLHAFDDCGEKDVPTHLCNIAADAIIELEARVKELEADRAGEETRTVS